MTVTCEAVRASGPGAAVRAMMFVLGITLAPTTGTMAGGDAGFQNALRVQPVDTPFVTTIRLEESLNFRDQRCKLWHAEHGRAFDGSGFPPLFLDMVGSPLEGNFPRSSIVYEAMTQTMREDWNDSRRMFLEAALTEGVEQVEAKVMYLLLAVQGSRWETPDSSCFGSCHPPGKKPLFWRPVAKEARVPPLVDWVRMANPPVEEIDRVAAQAIRAPGPHIFPQPDCSHARFALDRYRLNCD